jgi:mycofactocin precursor peptide peptidase
VTSQPPGSRDRRGRRLADLSWPEVDGLGRAGAMLVVPVGATEQHGPHLPLSTDTEIARALADGLAGQRDDVVVAPSVPYGSSGEHEGFAGTLSIGQDATRLVLVELVRSASRTFRRILLVVGHGGNTEPVRDAVSLLRAEGRDVLAWGPRFGGDAHAGFTETSLLLALAPSRVDLARAEAGAGTPVVELLPVLRQGGVRAVSPNGVLGDPAGATPEQGAVLLAEAVEALRAWVERWEDDR